MSEKTRIRRIKYEKKVASGVLICDSKRMIRRLFVEEKNGSSSTSLLNDIKGNLNIPALEGLRVLQRYDVEGLEQSEFDKVRNLIFCEAPVENLFEEQFPLSDAETAFAIEFLPGQFDQRADSAEQCVQIVARCRPKVACARVFVLKGKLSESDIDRVKKYLINSVDSREASMAKPETLVRAAKTPADVAVVEGFVDMDMAGIAAMHKKMSLAMSVDDLEFCRKYFAQEQKRNPTITEIRLLDTYWSDHCRHTTFLTKLENVKIDGGELNNPVKRSWDEYLKTRADLGLEKRGKNVCLMDVALIAMRALKAQGKLEDLEQSEEINAASIVVNVDIDGKPEEYLVMFKNETHNHPTEIEPFGGAATCLGGAIRDPLSGRSYVYQAMRVTGAGDPRTPFDKTLAGKLPQRKIVLGAANGYSSYGNQIGLATGQVCEIYHEGYVAKRMEIGAVVAAAPRCTVRRGVPEKGDFILLCGGRTGRDGIGGATGSSKDHTEHALENSAEVQKGDAPMERKLQRLFRNPKASLLIKRCNDFGAGGVSVAIGELAPSLEINLDAVKKKYDGLDGTELAISESQERMAVVVSPQDADEFARYAAEENLECTHVATVTDTGRLVMKWRGKSIVDISRAFLDTNGTVALASAEIEVPTGESPLLKSQNGASNTDKNAWIANLRQLNCASQRGLIERFDSSIGASAVLHPFGGKNLATQPEAMCSKIPLLKGETNTGTLFSFGFNPNVSSWSPYFGAIYSVVESVAKIAAAGGDISKIRFTFQEYFEKLRTNPTRWGKPLAALLGAFEAQMRLGCAAIGGKDSMSGSFNDIDVPPTLVSFAMCPCDVRFVISPEFKKAGSTVALLEISKNSLMPDWHDLRAKYAKFSEAVKAGEISAAHSVRFGGLAEAVAKMSFGNSIGFEFAPDFKGDVFALNYGAIVAEVASPEVAERLGARVIGKTTAAAEVKIGGLSLEIGELFDAWNAPLEGVYQTKAKPSQDGGLLAAHFENKNVAVAKNKVARPRVFIPVFPGSNCEYDSARAFEAAGARTDTFVFRNLSDKDVAESIAEMKKRIDAAQILMIPGGFSAGDEPAGSGKFIAAVFRNAALTDAVMSLLKDRKGLVLGICNGFQALIKLGLVPFGEVRELKADSPTLTYNNIARHVSCYVNTKVASKLSPWFADCELGDVHSIPVSHGEGKFIAPEHVIRELERNGQIATQYVDSLGRPSAEIPFNPNGSMHAIEGITSPDGLVLGKMGHSERFGANVGKNISGNKIQPIFTSGVKYFR